VRLLNDDMADASAAVRVRNVPFGIDSDNPFAGDLLERQTLSDTLTQLVQKADDSFVLALDAPWGGGKTTFLRMWLSELKRQGTASIYFNAWEHDFTGDPLACLLGELKGLMNEVSGTKRQADRLKKVGGRLLRRGVPVAAKLLTAGLVDAQTFKDLHEAVGGMAAKIAEDTIEEYAKGKRLAEEFRSVLREAVEKVSEETSQGKKKPLVYVIDELDRCRPTFAVEMLERTKHFFNVPGVIFILGVDKVALGTSLQTIYGSGFDSSSYLRRFIDFDILLPRASSRAFVASLIGRFNVKDFAEVASRQSGEQHYLIYILSGLFEVCAIPPRAQEQTLARIGLMCRLQNGIDVWPWAAATLLSLMACDMELYYGFRCGKYQGLAVMDKWNGRRCFSGQ
jgi:hypothetical protein